MCFLLMCQVSDYVLVHMKTLQISNVVSDYWTQLWSPHEAL